MSDLTSFTCAELTDIGLLASADPHFAERLFDALRRLPLQPDSEAPEGAQVNPALDAA
jgi:hypothetical protein